MEQREQRARNSPYKTSPSKAPQPPRIGTREEEEEEESHEEEEEEKSSSSSSSSSSSTTAPTVNVNTTLFAAPKLVAKDFEGCGGWAPLKLMEECVSQHVSLTNPDYGSFMKAGPKANNKKVLDEMLKFATAEQLTSLKQVIGGNVTDTSTMIQRYKAACVDIQKKMIDNLMQREASLPSAAKVAKTTAGGRMKKNHETGGKLSVTSVAKRLQNVTKAENESQASEGQTALPTLKGPIKGPRVVTVPRQEEKEDEEKEEELDVDEDLDLDEELDEVDDEEMDMVSDE
jgi:hypothetical protein